jgi:hypothetical protein
MKLPAALELLMEILTKRMVEQVKKEIHTLPDLCSEVIQRHFNI